jgi:hypothetical protein
MTGTSPAMQKVMAEDESLAVFHRDFRVELVAALLSFLGWERPLPTTKAAPTPLRPGN